jgi:DNA-binding transcriptional MerR regulator
MQTNTLINGFTRQETATLCSVLPTRLSYLDRTGLISPQKFGNPKKPTCVYSWQQILEIKAIAKLREDVSLQTVRQIISFLEKHADNPSLVVNDILVINGEVFWYNPSLIDDFVVQIKSKIGGNEGQICSVEILRIPSLDALKGEVIEIARKTKKVDFASFKERAMIA